MGETLNENLLTTGSIPKKIIMFAIPLLWGNLFQQLYNVADSLIVGNFLGNNALAAVSSSGNLIFLMVGFFGGIGVGAGVVIARYFGAGEYEKLKKAIHTALAFGGVCGIFLTVAALILAPQILKLIGTPEEVLPKSLVYFRVYFAGSLGFVIYNFGMGILQSLGDSKSPVIYLIISACLNVILDLVLIGGLGFGVGAAAFATIVSQILSAVLCIRKLRREPEAFRLSFRELLIKNVGTNPTRAGILEVCRAMGADITYLNENCDSGEPTADLLVRTSALHGTTVEGAIIPTLIDEIPMIAVMAAFAEGTTIIRDAAELKVKETDRIKTTTEGLLAMGVDVTPTDDGMIIRGGNPVHGGQINSYLDHRIAMAFSIAALAAEGNTEIQDYSGDQCNLLGISTYLVYQFGDIFDSVS